MLGKTKPKIVFCESRNIDRVREALTQLGTSVPIFTFDGLESESNIKKLLSSTGEEKDFMYETQSIICAKILS